MSASIYLLIYSITTPGFFVGDVQRQPELRFESMQSCEAALDAIKRGYKYDWAVQGACVEVSSHD